VVAARTKYMICASLPQSGGTSKRRPLTVPEAIGSSVTANEVLNDNRKDGRDDFSTPTRGIAHQQIMPL